MIPPDLINFLKEFGSHACVPTSLGPKLKSYICWCFENKYLYCDILSVCHDMTGSSTQKELLGAILENHIFILGQP